MTGHGLERGLVRVLAISLLAAALPVAGAFLFPDSLQDYEALTWLLLLVPAFLWAYERGWRGVATALALGMAALSVTYAGTQATGGRVPDLLLAVVVVYVAVSIGIGLFGDRLARAKFDAAAERLALQDPLTGLPNRRHSEMHLAMEFAAAERGRALAVVLFDVDHLDEYNVRNGRAAGDGVLRGFGSLLRQVTRRMDLAGRYGPDQFVSVLGGCVEEGAVIFAGRVQERLRAAEHTVALPTVSAGIACYTPQMKSPDELLRAAGEALTLAKQEGRDRVRIHGRDLDAMREPDSSAVQRAVAEAAEAGALEAMANVRFNVATPADGPVGAGRSAFLLTGNDAARARLASFLREDGFHVVEGHALPDTITPIQNEFDVVFVDIAPEGAAVEDLIREIRSRAPLTRVIGIPQGGGGALAPELLRIRVDGHYVASGDMDSLRRQLRELLAERDALHAVQVRHHQLSNELRTVDREARMALAASEARYRSVVQTIQEVIFTADAHGRWTFLNLAWTAVTGFDIDTSLGRPLFDFVHPEDEPGLREQFARFVDSRAAYLRHEGRWRTRSGSHRWVETRMQLTLSPQGAVEGVSGVLTDVTERRRAEDALRQSEEYFRSLIESSADLIAVLNADGTIRYVSPAVERVLGIRASAWIGTDGFHAVHPDDVQTTRSALGAIADRPGDTTNTQVRMRRGDGTWCTLDVTARNLLLKGGVQGIVINARDVTERRRTEQALRESEEMLQQAQKMDAIGRLAGGVAHDFNNLLTAIQGHADLLITEVGANSPTGSDLLQIRDAAARATSLTRQLLAFSRRQVLQPRVIDVNTVVHDMHTLLNRMIGEHVSLALELAGEPVCVMADPAQMEQVVMNLIVNARDAMADGGVITVTTEEVTVEADDSAATGVEPGTYASLRVTDTGSGMTSDTVAQVFDPFFTTKAPGRGTGLGLSTVYGIVKQSGGHVAVASQPGTGTTFTVLLPVVDGIPTVREPQAAPAAHAAAGGRRILLVEDEKSVRDLSLRILLRGGYEVVTASNGREALDVLRADPRPFDLVLTDVVMPVMSGQQLAARVLEMLPGTRIMFMSGYNEEAVLRHGVLAEGTAFLEKPFSPAELLQRVRDLLDGDTPLTADGPQPAS